MAQLHSGRCSDPLLSAHFPWESPFIWSLSFCNWNSFLQIALTRSIILYSSLKFLCLGSIIIQIIIFILNKLKGCSMRIQNRYSESNSTWIQLVNKRRGESYWLSASLAHFLLALVISLRRQVLLYAHSKCLGNCSMRIQNMAGAALFSQIGT